MDFQEARARHLAAFDAAVVRLRGLLADGKWLNANQYDPIHEAVVELGKATDRTRRLNEAEALVPAEARP